MNALRNEQGMTLIEIIAVLVVLGIVVAIIAVRFVSFGEMAKETTLAMAVAELNERERMTWSLVRLDPDKESTDEVIYAEMNFDLGIPKWQSRSITGGVLQAEGGTVSLSRTPSTDEAPAKWERN